MKYRVEHLKQNIIQAKVIIREEFGNEIQIPIHETDTVADLKQQIQVI